MNIDPMLGFMLAGNCAKGTLNIELSPMIASFLSFNLFPSYTFCIRTK